MFTVQAADQRNHRFGSGFTIRPVFQALLVLGLVHGCSFRVLGSKGPILCGGWRAEAIIMRKPHDYGTVPQTGVHYRLFAQRPSFHAR